MVSFFEMYYYIETMKHLLVVQFLLSFPQFLSARAVLLYVRHAMPVNFFYFIDQPLTSTKFVHSCVS